MIRRQGAGVRETFTVRKVSLRRRRRAHLPGALAEHRPDRGRSPAATSVARSSTTCVSCAARPRRSRRSARRPPRPDRGGGSVASSRGATRAPRRPAGTARRTVRRTRRRRPVRPTVRFRPRLPRPRRPPPGRRRVAGGRRADGVAAVRSGDDGSRPTTSTSRRRRGGGASRRSARRRATVPRAGGRPRVGAPPAAQLLARAADPDRRRAGADLPDPDVPGKVYVIPSGSMETTLHGCTGCVNDRVLVDKVDLPVPRPAAGRRRRVPRAGQLAQRVHRRGARRTRWCAGCRGSGR